MSKKVKARVVYEFELDVPETIAFDVYPIHFPRELVFHGLTNYAVCAHLRDATKWSGKTDKVGQSIANHHNYWADLLEKANPEIEVVSVEDRKTAYYAAYDKKTKKIVSYSFKVSIPKDDEKFEYKEITKEEFEKNTPWYER